MNAVNLDVKITSCINIVKQYPEFIASCITFGYYDEKWISIDLWHSFLFAPPRPPPEHPVSQAPQEKNPALHASLGGRDSLIQKRWRRFLRFLVLVFPQRRQRHAASGAVAVEMFTSVFSSRFSPRMFPPYFVQLADAAPAPVLRRGGPDDTVFIVRFFQPTVIFSCG